MYPLLCAFSGKKATLYQAIHDIFVAGPCHCVGPTLAIGENQKSGGEGTSMRRRYPFGIIESRERRIRNSANHPQQSSCSSSFSRRAIVLQFREIFGRTLDHDQSPLSCCLMDDLQIWRKRARIITEMNTLARFLIQA